MEDIIRRSRQQEEVPRLLLHACCAPCSSACLEYLREFFRVTVFYYNPNITDRAEYESRRAEELRLIREYNAQLARAAACASQEEAETALREAGMLSTPAALPVDILEAPYDPERFLAMAAGMEEEPEGGARCAGCYALRMEETARAAFAGGYDFFTTTLTISPLKDADKLNAAGEAAAERIRSANPESGLRFLPSDFKKKDGYLRSIRLSQQFGLYRQDYCGCEFSRSGADNAHGIVRNAEHSEPGMPKHQF